MCMHKHRHRESAIFADTAMCGTRHSNKTVEILIPAPLAFSDRIHDNRRAGEGLGDAHSYLSLLVTAL